MSETVIVALISSSGTFVLGVLGIIAAYWWRSKRMAAKNRSDNAHGVMSEATAIEILQRTIKAQAEEMERLRKVSEADLESVRVEVEDLRRQIDELKQSLTQRDHWVRDLIDWVRRLIYQIKSYGFSPVSFRSAFPDVDEGEVMKKINTQ